MPLLHRHKRSKGDIVLLVHGRVRRDEIRSRDGLELSPIDHLWNYLVHVSSVVSNGKQDTCAFAEESTADKTYEARLVPQWLSARPSSFWMTSREK